VEDIKTDRAIAETHYHIGVACVYSGRYDDGVTHFRDAITILKAKNTALEAVVAAAEGKDGSEEAAEVTAARSEMKDIAELIPEIKLKVHYLSMFSTTPNIACFISIIITIMTFLVCLWQGSQTQQA